MFGYAVGDHWYFFGRNSFLNVLYSLCEIIVQEPGGGRGRVQTLFPGKLVHFLKEEEKKDNK